MKSSFKATLRIFGAPPTRSTRTDDDLEAQGVPSNRLAYDRKKYRTSDAIVVAISEPSTLPAPLTPLNSPLNSPVDQDFSSYYAATPTTDDTTTVGKQLWQKAFRNLKMRDALPPPAQLNDTVPMLKPPLIRHQTSSSSLSDFSIFDNKKKASTSDSVRFSRSRISTFVPKLIELEVTHDLAAHTALVRHMQFSPDGQFLATSR